MTITERPKPRSDQESTLCDSLGPQTFRKMCDLWCWNRAEVTGSYMVQKACASQRQLCIIEEFMNATWPNIALLHEFHVTATGLLIKWDWWSKLLQNAYERITALSCPTYVKVAPQTCHGDSAPPQRPAIVHSQDVQEKAETLESTCWSWLVHIFPLKVSESTPSPANVRNIALT